MNFIPLIFYSLSFLMTGIYAFVIFKALCGIRRIESNAMNTHSHVVIDVIVPYFNESVHLPKVLESLQNQTHKNYRVIWINDHSTDGGEKFLKENAGVGNNLFLHSDKFGKKAAINEALNEVSADLIVFTDADCEHHPDWLTGYASAFEKKGSGLYFGPVVYTTNSFLQEVFALEFLSLMGTGMGLAGVGTPVFMNGANYAVSKDLLNLHVRKDGDKYASGDDVFLLHQVKKTLGVEKIYPISNQKLKVRTDAPKNPLSFFKQRIRWGGKTTGYKEFNAIMLAGLIFTFSVLQIASLFLISISKWTIIIWPVKSILDFIALKYYSLIWGQRHFVIAFLVLIPVYPFYILSTGLIGLFSNKSKW
jgi:glycosyltransferase involved in cell wall biosynthesis